MLHAIANQTMEKRKYRAKVIHADNEFQASKVLGWQLAAIAIALFQTLTAITGNKSLTVIFP